MNFDGTTWISAIKSDGSIGFLRAYVKSSKIICLGIKLFAVMGSTFSYVCYGVNESRQVELSTDHRGNYSGSPRVVLFGSNPKQDKGDSQWYNNSRPGYVIPERELKYSENNKFPAWFVVDLEHSNSGSHTLKFFVFDGINQLPGYCLAVKGFSSGGYKEWVFSSDDVMKSPTLEVESWTKLISVKVWKMNLVEPYWTVGHPQTLTPVPIQTRKFVLERRHHDIDRVE